MGLGCVKTLEAVVAAQQTNRSCEFDDSFMRQRRFIKAEVKSTCGRVARVMNLGGPSLNLSGLSS